MLSKVFLNSKILIFSKSVSSKNYCVVKELSAMLDPENPPFSPPSKRKIDDVMKCEIKSKKLKSEHEIPSPDVYRESRKLKKVVMLLCYLGKNYFGMQRNNGVITVEEDLLKALYRANVILESEFNAPKTMKFQRAARTDKGVSAIRQIVSLKIPNAVITHDFPPKVNQFLPPEIRVICVRKVTQSFDAKITCDARTYSYMLPTFAFSDKAEDCEEYRISGDHIKEVNEFLQLYLGTHNYYNFTSGRLPTDASCKRFIISIECGKPFIQDGLEFCVIQIKGQSFMLHQIRKMVGLAISVMRNLAPKDVIEKAWKTERIDIPKAPGLGLMLDEVHYEWYNKKYGGDGMHEMLAWDEFQDTLYKFKKEQIYHDIALTEKCEKSMLQWLETLSHHTFDVRRPGAPTEIPVEGMESKPIDISATEICSSTTEILAEESSSEPKEIAEEEENRAEDISSTQPEICTEETHSSNKCEK